MNLDQRRWSWFTEHHHVIALSQLSYRHPSMDVTAEVVEFAFAAPVLFLIVFGIIEFGRVMMIQNALTSSARERCRKASSPV